MGKFYVDGNIIEGNEEVTQDNWTKGIYGQINNASCDNTFTKKVKKEMRLSEPLDAGIITTHSAKQAYELVLDQAGCSRQRDAIDIRVIEETRNGTATYIGSVTKRSGKCSRPDRLAGRCETGRSHQPLAYIERWRHYSR